MGGGVTQLPLAAPPEAIAPAAIQLAAVPVIRQRAEAHPWVLSMIASGELDFLDVKHLPAGVKEPKVPRKKPAPRRSLLPWSGPPYRGLDFRT